MNFIFSLIPTLIVLGILILIHELGHFIACRLTKVRVEKFSIGFGPEILHWQGRETRYAISLFPLGGFVKPAGESVSEVDAEGPKPGDYLAASIPARILIVVAGVAMNYFLAYWLFVSVFMMGRPVPGTVIGGFVEGYPAKEMGLQAGDRIAQINEQPINTWAEMTDVLQTAPPGELLLTVERPAAGKAQIVMLRMTPRVDTVKDIFGESFQMKRLGVMPDPQAYEFEKFGFLEAIRHAWETLVNLTVLTYKAIFYLILGKLSIKTMAGPIGIVAMTGSAAKLGLPYLLQLTANLSVSLAVINLLPIPALDGGHLLFLLIEAVRRKRVSLEFQERMTQAGFILLMLLMVFILYNDLANLQAFEKLKEFLHLSKP